MGSTASRSSWGAGLRRRRSGADGREEEEEAGLLRLLSCRQAGRQPFLSPFPRRRRRRRRSECLRRRVLVVK